MLVAGFDSSTQSCKLVIRDAETGELIRQGRASHLPGTEVDPANWWAAAQEATAAAGGLDDVTAISVAGQQHGMVALDADGNVVRDALLWNDTRSAGAARSCASTVKPPRPESNTPIGRVSPAILSISDITSPDSLSKNATTRDASRYERAATSSSAVATQPSTILPRVM